MSIRTADYLDAINHLPDETTLVVEGLCWDDYEALLQEIGDSRPNLRICYDQGRLEIMSPGPKHDKYAFFIGRLMGVISEEFDLVIEGYGHATWKRELLQKGVEADGCFYVASAAEIIGKEDIDLDVDPPPDIAVEVDISTDSKTKFSIYAGLRVPEIWRYDGKALEFYELSRGAYRRITSSRCLPKFPSNLLTDALDASKAQGQTAALRTFRKQLRKLK